MAPRLLRGGGENGRSERSSSTRLLFAVSVLAAVAATLVRVPSSLAEPTEAGVARSAQHLRAGSIARDRVVALGRDLIVEGEVRGHAVAVEGTAQIFGDVDGDVLVLGGDVRLGEAARVGGDVYVLGGRIDADSGAVVAGRMIAYPEAGAAWLALMEGPTLGTPSTAPAVLGAKLALLAFWALLSLGLFAVGRRSVLRTAAGIRDEPFRNFFVGLTAVAAFVLTAIFFYALSGALIGIPLLALVVVVALGLRFWGLVAVFYALGEWTASLRPDSRPGTPLGLVGIGLGLLAVVRFVPWVGTWTWTVATLIGVGGALTTRLGQRDPWFDGL